MFTDCFRLHNDGLTEEGKQQIKKIYEELFNGKVIKVENNGKVNIKIGKAIYVGMFILPKIQEPLLCSLNFSYDAWRYCSAEEEQHYPPKMTKDEADAFLTKDRETINNKLCPLLKIFCDPLCISRINGSATENTDGNYTVMPSTCRNPSVIRE